VDVSPRSRDPSLPTGRALGPWSPHQPQGYAPGPRPAPYGPIGLPHR